jgi:hypothetical protein
VVGAQAELTMQRISDLPNYFLGSKSFAIKDVFSAAAGACPLPDPELFLVERLLGRLAHQPGYLPGTRSLTSAVIYWSPAAWKDF